MASSSSRGMAERREPSVDPEAHMRRRKCQMEREISLRRVFSILVLLLSWYVLRADISHATIVDYLFEPPQFTLGQTTPFLDVAPNFGPTTFLTSFTDDVDPNGYQITNDVNENVLGQSLFAPVVTSPLTLAFN